MTRDNERGNNLACSWSIQVESFHALCLRQLVDSYIEQIKTAAPAPGFTRVYLPGEPEFGTRARREAEGIPVPQAVWKTLAATGQELGVEL